MSVADEPGFFFLDTNILVYAFDRNEPAKQGIAEQLIDDALATRRGIISTQVVQEFISLALRKFARRIAITECREYLQAVLVPLCQYFPSIST